MYKYRFWKFDYEYPMDVVLQHEKLFTKEKFKDMVSMCIKEVNEQLDKNIDKLDWLEKNDKWESLTEEECLNLENLNGDWDIIPQTIKRLINNYGFINIKDEIELLFNFDKNEVEKG